MTGAADQHNARQWLPLVDAFLSGIDDGSPSTRDVATACGVDYKGFRKLFRSEVGVSAGRYLALWRARRAERLLLETNLSLNAIARHLGYSNAANFSTFFKRELRQPPAYYRRTRQSVVADQAPWLTPNASEPAVDISVTTAGTCDVARAPKSAESVPAYRRPLLAEHEALLTELVRANPRITLAEIRAVLLAKGIRPGCLTTIWSALRKFGVERSQ